MNQPARDFRNKLARMLRDQMTEPEKILWLYLRRRGLDGLKFRRQHPLGRFIVDFVCLEKRVVIELDGSQHLEQERKDHERDNWLTSQGYKVLRFYNNELYQQREEVLEKIVDECRRNTPIRPNGHLPPLRGKDYGEVR